MKKQIKILIILLVAVSASTSLIAQSELRYKDITSGEDNRKGKLFLIPEAGLWFGTYTNIEVAPQLGFHLTDRLSAGAGPHYLFYQNNSYYSPVNFSTHIWGIKIFSRLSIIKNAAEVLPFYLFDELFLHAEYERMSLEQQYFNAPSFPEEGRFGVSYLYAGAGISQRIQENTSYNILLLWNLNHSYYSLYRNPTYRVGLSIYF